MAVTLGAGGSIFVDRLSGDAGFEPTKQVDVVDSCGAGDAFFAGTVMGLVQGQSLRQAVSCGTRAAEWTIQSSETTCRDLNQCLESMNKKGDSISKSPGA